MQQIPDASKELDFTGQQGYASSMKRAIAVVGSKISYLVEDHGALRPGHLDAHPLRGDSAYSRERRRIMTLEKLIHDVNSKCSSLKDAAKLLPDSTAAERKELLGLMVAQTRALADALAIFERAQ